VETDAIPRQAHEKIEQMGTADLVVGVLADFGDEGVAGLYDSLKRIPGPLRIVVFQDTRRRPAAAAPPGAQGAENSEAQNAANGSSLVVLPLATEPDDPSARVSSMFTAYQSVFSAAETLEARGCCVLVSKLQDTHPQWFCRLAQNLVEKELDLLLPHYAQHRLEGLLNAAMISPLIRSLYGKRIRNPMGPDLGVSRRLFQKMLSAEHSATGSLHPLASLAPKAICDNMKVSELYLGHRVHPPTDWTNVSSLLAQVLGPVFVDMERNAPCWQRVRGAMPVPAIGDPVFVAEDTGTVDISHMVELFQLGNRELQEIWGLMLPPMSLIELRKLASMPLAQFRMADELWVRIVYDFALAHRLRTISRDHLIKSMTPLYLAWVASYARELQSAGKAASDNRLERLALAFESGKPYLVSRWRWPDRFSP
jgi:glucosylglycerate synthase